MGGYMGGGAEICDLQGLFLFNDLRKLSKSECIGLYRDNGLIVISWSNCEQERIGKNLRSIVEEHRFHITIVNGLFQTDFLDVKLN